MVGHRKGDGVTELSIVMPTYNDAVFLVEALASVDSCTQGRFEVLILDDGSTCPESLEVLARLREAGYEISRQENGGLSKARNTLIRSAKGRFILPLDADNRLVPGFIERALRAFDDDPGLGVVYRDRRLFGAASGIVLVPDFDPLDNLNGNEIDACAVYRREVWEDVGGYDEELRCLEDWEFWVHAGKRGWRFRRRLLQRHPDLLLRLSPGPIRWLAGGASMKDSRSWKPNLWQRIVLAVFWMQAWETPRFAPLPKP